MKSGGSGNRGSPSSRRTSGAPKMPSPKGPIIPQQCRAFASGHCLDGEACRFLHGDQELKGKTSSPQAIVSPTAISSTMWSEKKTEIVPPTLYEDLASTKNGGNILQEGLGIGAGSSLAIPQERRQGKGSATRKDRFNFDGMYKNIYDICKNEEASNTHGTYKLFPDTRKQIPKSYAVAAGSRPKNIWGPTDTTNAWNNHKAIGSRKGIYAASDAVPDYRYNFNSGLRELNKLNAESPPYYGDGRVLPHTMNATAYMGPAGPYYVAYRYVDVPPPTYYQPIAATYDIPVHAATAPAIPVHAAAMDVKVELCKYHIENLCKYGESCRYEHGIPCYICQKNVIHPRDSLEADRHFQYCLKEKRLREKKASSAEVECAICIEKPSILGRKFGLLLSCEHAFCLTCIRHWRDSSTSIITDKIRKCPVCRRESELLIPSDFYINDVAEKKQMEEQYRARLRTIACKHFDYGEKVCPFGRSCLYSHRDRQGRYIDCPPNTSLVYSSSGEMRAKTTPSLADFLPERF